MSSEKLYRKKYLKYKNKYINLQTQIGGDDDYNNFFIQNKDSFLYPEMKQIFQEILLPILRRKTIDWEQYTLKVDSIIQIAKYWQDYLLIIKKDPKFVNDIKDITNQYNDAHQRELILTGVREVAFKQYNKPSDKQEDVTSEKHDIFQYLV